MAARWGQVRLWEVKLLPGAQSVHKGLGFSGSKDRVTAGAGAGHAHKSPSRAGVWAGATTIRNEWGAGWGSGCWV